MPSLSSDARFFGLDLKALWCEVRVTWQRALQKPPLGWLTPALPIVLLHADRGSTQTVWLGDEVIASAKKQDANAFVAVELPEDLLLRRRLQMPAMAAADVASAVELEVLAHSPFVASDLVWGYRDAPAHAGIRQLEVVLASRQQVAQYLATLEPRFASDDPPEVWARSSGTKSLPIVLGGYGEGRRRASMRRLRAVNCALLALCVLLLMAMAATPTLQLRQRAIQAAQAYEDVMQRTAATARKREALMQSIEKLDALSQVLAGRVEPLRVLDKLTRVLPDDTAVQSFKLSGAKVTIAGDTNNASTLLRLLGEQAGLRDVKAPTAATRMLGAAKESYVIEFVVDPQLFGVAQAADGQPAVSAAPVMASEPPASTVPSPASAAATPVAAPSAPVPQTGGATFGGRATFGGSRPPTSNSTAGAKQ